MAVLLPIGLLAVFLAGVPSEVFDLERWLVPKELALHAVALLALLLGRPFRDRRLDAVDGLLFAFVLWSAASAALATNGWLAARGWGITFSAVVLYLVARRTGGDTDRGRWRVIGGIVAATVVAASLGIAQAYGVEWPWLADSRPPGGTFGNRNFLAHTAALAVPLALVGAARARSWWSSLAWALGVAVLAAAVVLTRSRAAWLAGGAGTAVALLLLVVGAARARRRLPLVRAALAGALLAAGVVAAVSLPNRLSWTSDAPYAATLERLADFREGSGAGRLVQYRHSLELVPLRPVLGVGPGNWFVHYPRVTAPGDPSWSGHLTIPTNPWPSSDWVAFVTERGPVGAALLLLAGLASVAVAVARRPSPAGGEASSAAALAGLLSAAVVAGLFDAVLLLAAPAALTFTSAGLLLSRPTRAPGREGRPHPMPAAAIAGGASWHGPVGSEAEDGEEAAGTGGRAGAAGTVHPPDDPRPWSDRKPERGAARGPARRVPPAVRWVCVVAAVGLVALTATHARAIALTSQEAGGRASEAVLRASRWAPGEHRLHLLLAERGWCGPARRAASLMPHHDRVEALVESCAQTDR